MWFSLGVTAFFLWLVLRDAPFADVARVIAGANWALLLGISVPAYVLVIYLRALRWKHLTATIRSYSTAELFRATAVGFMANNLFPLRMGEVIRSWFLSRDAGGSKAAIFGTVVLERVIDMVTVIALALGVLALLGAGHDGVIARGALLLIPVALAPLAALVLLEVAPDAVIGSVTRVAGWFSTRLAAFLDTMLRRFSVGLGALRRGPHQLWVVSYTLLIWLIASTAPLLAAFASVGVDFGSPLETVAAAWITQAAIGMAIALPSAPGFFGPYHYACKLALERFGIPPETAIALGTLIHAIFWVSLTGLGLVVLRVRRTSFGEIDDAASPSENTSDGKAPLPKSR
ncbi:MAG: lysylphosphatidylglycerol synthase transmembrane domain-containing protein [Myxococcota bacterium]